jgi:hypothetical protein
MTDITDMIDDEWPSNNPPDPVDVDHIQVAVDKFLASNFADGQLITHAWLHEALGIPEAPGSMPKEQAQPLQFRYMSAVGKVRDILLEEHSIALRSVHGDGYSIVPPAEQPAWAKRGLNKDLNKAFILASSRATFVRTDGLTDAQKNEMTAVQAGISTMKSHLSAARAKEKRGNFWDVNSSAQ